MTAKPKFEPRKLMEKAIEVMRQAESKAEEENQREEIVLSEYEKTSPDVLLADLSTDALKRYHSFLGMEEPAGSPAFHRRLQQQGLLEETDAKWVPTGFGTLLFGKHPRDTIAQAGLLGTIHYTEGKEEVRDFDGPTVLVSHCHEPPPALSEIGFTGESRVRAGN